MISAVQLTKVRNRKLAKAISDCGWGGRKDCMDYKAWEDAWASVTG